MMNNNQQVVVSMTSFPAAIPYAEQAIRSVLEGSVLPDRFVLYLSFAQFGEAGIPSSLRSIEESNSIFEIRDCDRDLRSYLKLIPALRDFPDALIVTVDDDVHYHRDMLRDLLRIHKEVPDSIIAHRAKRIKIGRPYKEWKKYHWYHFVLKRLWKSPLTLQTGVGGVLYPPHCLSEEMLNPDLFTNIAPTTDDIWFWAAAIKHGTYIVPVPFGENKPHEIGKPNSMALKRKNYMESEDRNREAIEAIMDRWPEIAEICSK